MAKVGKRTPKGKKKDKKPVGTSWDSVREKTVSYGKTGKKNKEEARDKAKKTATSVGSAIKSNWSVNEKKTPQNQPKKKEGYKGASRSGAVKPVSTTGTKKRAGAVRARENNDVKTAVNVTKLNPKVKNYINPEQDGFNGKGGKYNPKNYTAAQNAYNKSKSLEEAAKKHGTKTVQVDSAQETRDKASEIYKSSTESESNQLGQVYNFLAKDAGKAYDDLVKQYGADAVKAQLGSKKDFVKSNYGSKDDYVKKGLSETEKERHKGAVEEAKGSGSYTYTKTPESVNQALIEQNASLFQNNKAKTKTDQDRYVTDKDGNIKYDIKIGKDGKLEIKPKKKKGKEKVETTQGANIIDYYAGGFNEKGQLTSQEGSQKVANTRAGWIHDAPFMTGVLQGFGRADIKRGLGQYSEAAAKDVDKTTSSGAFTAGYMTGFGLQFPMMQVNKMTDAMVRGVTKAGVERTALNIGLRKGAASATTEMPMNMLDALKMSTDAKGNVDKGSFGTWAVVNTLLSGGMGGVIGGVGAKMTKATAREYLTLAAKARSGLELTDDEIVRLQTLDKKLASARDGSNIANSDIAYRADYDEQVMKKVFDKGGTVDEAIKTLDGAGTNVEKINYAVSIKEEANMQFEQLRAQRNAMLEAAKNMSEEDAAVMIREANGLSKEINRLGELVNVAEKQLAISEKRNRTALNSLTKSLDGMSEKTGVNYRVMNDKDIRGKINEELNRRADDLEAMLNERPNEFSPKERAEIEAKIKEYREGVSDNLFYKGFYYKNADGETEILINSESPQAHQTVIGHETGHLIKKASEEEFFKLADDLEAYAKKMGDWDSVYEQLKRAYPDATPQDLREEITCELLGRYVFGNDDAFIKRLAGEQPSVLQKIVDYFKKLLSGTTDREMSKELQAIIDKTEKLVGEIKPSENKIGDRTTVDVSENIPANELDKSGVTVEKDGTPVAEFAEDGSIKFSHAVYEKEGRPVIVKFVDNLSETEGLTKAEGEEVVHSMDTIDDICKRLADKTDENGNPVYASFSQWSYADVRTGKDGKPLMTAHLSDDEYPIDFDFATVCVRRENLDGTLSLLAERGVLERLFLADEAQQGLFVGKINDIIRAHGLETSCEVCYVDVKRPRMFGTAREFADTHNDLVQSLYKDKSKIDSFNYGGDKTVARVEDGIHTLDDSELDFTHVLEVVDEERQKAADAIENGLKKEKNEAKRQKQIEKMNAYRNGELDSGSVRSRMAKAVLEDPSQRKLLSVNDMMDSETIARLREDNPSLEKLINSKKGQRGTKLPLPYTQYLGEIIKKKSLTADKAWAMGGFRAQSYSDFNINLVMEYVQMFGEAALKEMPSQLYSKVPMETMLFGLTGAKQNMSMIPAVKKGFPAGLDESGNYLWDAKQSFPWELARKIQNADGYKDNCGTIAIGVSDEQIVKMLKDPEVHMVIPYHASTVNPVVAKARNIGGFKNYEHYQITRTKSGAGVAKDFEWNKKIHALTHDENHNLKPREEWGNPQDVVDEYLRWCEEHEYTPKFPQFAYHEDPEVRAGYYKVLTDYSMFDNNGNFTPQMAVEAKFPQAGDAFGDMESLIKKGLRKQSGLEAKRKKELPAIADEVVGMAKENGWLSDEPKFSRERKQPLKEASAKAESSKAKLDELTAARETEVKTADELARKQRNTAMFSNAKDKAERLKEIKAQKAESDARLAEIDKQIKTVNKEIAEAQKVIDQNADRLASGRKAKTAEKVENWRNEIDGFEKEIADKRAQIKELDKADLNKMTPLQADAHLDKRNALVHEIEDLQSKIESRNNSIQKSTLIKAQRDAVNAPEVKPKKAETAKAKPAAPEKPVKPKETSKETTPAAKPAKKSAFLDSDEYKTFNETPSAYASNRLKEMTVAADGYGVDVAPRIKEFNDLNKQIRGLKGKNKNSSNPEHIAQNNAEIEAAEVRQTAIARSIYQDVAEERLKVAGVDAVSAREISKALTNVGGVSTISKDIKNASKGTGSKKANKLVSEEMKDYDACLEKYLKGDEDLDMQNARASQLLDNIAERLTKNAEDQSALDDLMKVVDKISEDGTIPTSVRNSAYEIMASTPKGRVGMALKAVDDLNKKYGERIKGTLKLTDEEKVNLATMTGEDLDNLYKEITERLWDEIPATKVEKLNEIRHMFMLLNVRTHARNMFGNFSFGGVKSIADELEAALQNKVFKNAIEKRGGEVDRVHVKKSEVKEHEDFLTDEFHKIYDKSDSKTRWKETNRPDGVPTVKMQALNWLIQKDYQLLEKEDMMRFIPEFRKSYTQYVKAKGWDITNLTEAQSKMARERALFDAEYATFRDTSALSAFLTGKKHMLATKQGKTIFGTAAYRMGNVALEGLIPFVKTPVNIFRRSVDYSPISLIRCIGELASKDPEVFKEGIKHLSSGLTGTGVFGLGVYLANNDYISIDTRLGGHSGSKYYDQDMGYQDYSLVINIGDYHASWTIDWLQPMQASLFMGAAFKDMVSNIKDGTGNIGTDAISALFAVTSPMLDSSFMSSTKDMIESFQRRAGKETAEGEPDMAGALAQMLFGDIPKNYISSAVPQLISQSANVIDPYKRDTRSTLEDPILASWDSAGKQMINRIPVLRNKLLNPKLDRWGDDVSTGNNIATRIFFSMMNPSNVKTITENKYDRELIKIRNNGTKKGSNDYKYFFYPFTGNPEFELANGKRMTYDDLYKYGKADRIEQTKMVRAMIDSADYNEVEWDKKSDKYAFYAKEVDSAHYIGDMVANHDTYGVNYAIKAMQKGAKTNSRDEADTATYKAYARNAGKDKDNETFWTWRVAKEELYARSHPKGDATYRVKGICAIQTGDDNLVKSMNLTGNKEPELRKYWNDLLSEAKGQGLKGKKLQEQAKKTAFDEMSTFCSFTSAYLENSGVSADHLGMISSSAGLSATKGKKMPERIYRAMGQFWNSAQAGGGLMLKYNKNGKYDLKCLEAYGEELSYRIENRADGQTEKDVVRDFIENDLGITDADEAACVYQTLYLKGNGKRYKNPYKAEIDDHLEWGENHDDEWGINSGKSGGGWGRGGRRGHRGGGGGGGKGKMPSTASGAIKGKVTNPFAGSNTSSASNLNDAYRKKVRKLREKTYK